MQSAKTKAGPNCVSDHALLLPTSDLNWRKYGKPLDHSSIEMPRHQLKLTGFVNSQAYMTLLKKCIFMNYLKNNSKIIILKNDYFILNNEMQGNLDK